MELTIEHNTDRAIRAIQAYAAFTGKNALAVLAQKANWITLNLIDTFREIRMSPLKPMGYAKSSGWKLGNLSPKAIELASKAMGGAKSIWAKVLDPNRQRRFQKLQTIQVSPLGLKRMKRGGRLASAAEQERLKNKDDVRLNSRAVGSFFEVMLRRRGSGYLAQSWKSPKYRQENLISALKQGGRYHVENLNPKAEHKKLGSVSGMVTGPFKYQMDMISNAPGMLKYRGLVSAAILKEAVKTEQWIIEHQAKAAQAMRGAK